MLGYPYSDSEYIVFTVRANRFLRNMVRAMVGTLIEVGRGRQEPSWISSLIESGSRSDAGMSVPGKALFFCGVSYGERDK
jgi:tRNA pseudouridine38-40 synthase